MDANYAVDYRTSDGAPVTATCASLADARNLALLLAPLPAVTWLRLRNVTTGAVLIEEWISGHRPDVETVCALLKRQAG